MKYSFKHFRRIHLPPLLAFVIFVSLWEGIIAIFDISPIILPPPTTVASTLLSKFPYLLQHSLITFSEAVLGFLAGSLAAFTLATLFHFSSFLERALYPYAIAFKAIPLVALAPIIVVWCGSGLASKIVLSAIISFFPVLVSTVQGFNSVDEESIDLMKAMSANKRQILIKLRLPHAMPIVFGGLRVSSIFAIIGAVVAEFVGASHGIGYVVKTASYYLDASLMFAGVIFAAIAGLLFFWSIVSIERRLVFWAHGNTT